MTCSLSLVSFESGLHLGLHSLLSLSVGKLEVSDPLAALRILENSGWTGNIDLSSWLLAASFLDSVWLVDDGLVDLGVEVLAGLGLGG